MLVLSALKALRSVLSILRSFKTVFLSGSRLTFKDVLLLLGFFFLSSSHHCNNSSSCSSKGADEQVKSHVEL